MFPRSGNVQCRDSLSAMNAKLILLFVTIIVAIASSLRAAETPPTTVTKRVNVEEYDKLRTDKNIIILDVRSAEEFKTGHIPGATNINVNSAGFDEAVAKLDKNKTYLVNCAVGMRSAKACKKLEAAGFKNLIDLGPGFDGWKKAGKPVEK